jgi:hypothetical protein
VVLTPDEAVREAIVTVFRRFDELGSARQVLIRLREDGVLLPWRANGSRRITWAPATYAAIHDLLTNRGPRVGICVLPYPHRKARGPDHRDGALAGSVGVSASGPAVNDG